MINKFKKVELKCPICGAKTDINGDKVLYCMGEKKHTYDISASGYINLASPKQCGGGDTKGAVKARSDFLDCGYYKPIADKTVELLKKYASKTPIVIDAGCGEGYYTLQLAKNADIAILCVGESYTYSGEANSRTDIRLSAAQRTLIKEVSAVKKQATPSDFDNHLVFLVKAELPLLLAVEPIFYFTITISLTSSLYILMNTLSSFASSSHLEISPASVTVTLFVVLFVSSFNTVAFVVE